MADPAGSANASDAAVRVEAMLLGAQVQSCLFGFGTMFHINLMEERGSLFIDCCGWYLVAGDTELVASDVDDNTTFDPLNTLAGAKSLSFMRSPNWTRCMSRSTETCVWKSLRTSSSLGPIGRW